LFHFINGVILFLNLFDTKKQKKTIVYVANLMFVFLVSGAIAPQDSGHPLKTRRESRARINFKTA
jgi:hypothetical protein